MAAMPKNPRSIHGPRRGLRDGTAMVAVPNACDGIDRGVGEHRQGDVGIGHRCRPQSYRATGKVHLRLVFRRPNPIVVITRHRIPRRARSASWITASANGPVLLELPSSIRLAGSGVPAPGIEHGHARLHVTGVVETLADGVVVGQVDAIEHVEAPRPSRRTGRLGWIRPGLDVLELRRADSVTLIPLRRQ